MQIGAIWFPPGHTVPDHCVNVCSQSSDNGKNIVSNCSQVTVPVLASWTKKPFGHYAILKLPLRSSSTWCLARTYLMRNKSVPVALMSVTWIVLKLCGLIYEGKAYLIWFLGSSDNWSGIVSTWSRASFQETTEYFMVLHNCHRKLTVKGLWGVILTPPQVYFR